MKNGTGRAAASSGLLLAVSYLGFISLGFPDAVIGVAWPSVRETFALNQSHLGYIFFGGGAGYFLSSFFSGTFNRALGLGLVLALSSALVAGSAFGYANATVWLLFASCSILHGLGSGAIDAGLNNYVAHHFAARHMNWLHACYSLGAMAGPLVMTAVITAGGGWRRGYGIIAATMLALALIFFATARLWGKPARDDGSSAQPKSSLADALRNRVVQWQMLIFFVYTGLEVAVGQWSFTVLTESRNIEPRIAGAWVSVYWAAIGVGRILFGFVVDAIGLNRLLRICTLAAICATALIAQPFSSHAAFAGLALTGLALAPIFPCLMTATPARLAPGLAPHAIGFQVSAGMFGAAALPTIAGFIATSAGLAWIAPYAALLALLLWAGHERLLRFPARV